MARKKTIEIETALPDKLFKVLRHGRVQDKTKALEMLIGKELPNSCELAIAAVADKSPTVRATACELLGEYGNQSAVQPLLRLVNDRDSLVRATCLESLGALLYESQSCPPELLARVDDSDELVRIMLAETLGLIGDSAVLSKLWQLLNDGSPIVRSFAATSIGELGTSDDLPQLVTKLDRETSDLAKVGFYKALYFLGKSEILSDLLSLLENQKDYRVRCAAANALAEIEGDSETAQQVIQALARAYQVEKTVAAKSTFETVLKQLQEEFDLEPIQSD